MLKCSLLMSLQAISRTVKVYQARSCLKRVHSAQILMRMLNYLLPLFFLLSHPSRPFCWVFPFKNDQSRRRGPPVYFELSSPTPTPLNPDIQNKLNQPTSSDLQRTSSKLITQTDFYRVFECKRSDLPAVVRLRTEVFHPQHMGDTSYFSTLLSKLSTRYNLGSIFLIASKPSPQSSELSEVIGTLEINDFDFEKNQTSTLPAPRLPSFGARRKLYLGDLAVKGTMRRKGVASCLLNVVEGIAKANDYKEIYLHVDRDQQHLLPFYRRNGYHVREYCDASALFTEHHLQSPARNYLLLCKSDDYSHFYYT